MSAMRCQKKGLEKRGATATVLYLGAIILAVSSTVFSSGCGNDRAGIQGQAAKRPAMIIAHRGVNKLAPENTIPSIETAIRMNLDYVEIDVRTTKDGQMILMHDDTVDDTTDGSGRVRDLTADEIRELDAGAWFSPEYAGIGVPFLEEALRVMQGRIGAYVDAKDVRPEALIQALQDTGMLPASVIYADPLTQWVIKLLEPDAGIMPEVGNLLLLFDLMHSLLEPGVVALSWGDPTKDFIDRIHSHGIETFMDVLGETDNPEGMRRALELGVDAIQTDHPDTLLEVMDSWNGIPGMDGKCS